MHLRDVIRLCRNGHLFSRNKHLLCRKGLASVQLTVCTSVTSACFGAKGTGMARGLVYLQGQACIAHSPRRTYGAQCPGVVVVWLWSWCGCGVQELGTHAQPLRQACDLVAQRAAARCAAARP